MIRGRRANGQSDSQHNHSITEHLPLPWQTDSSRYKQIVNELDPGLHWLGNCRQFRTLIHQSLVQRPPRVDNCHYGAVSTVFYPSPSISVTANTCRPSAMYCQPRSVKSKGQKRLKEPIALNEMSPITQLWGVTCHAGSHSVTCHHGCSGKF